MADSAGVPERPKGAGCKPAGSAYEGSNPSPCIHWGAPRVGICGSRSRPAPISLKGRFAPGWCPVLGRDRRAVLRRVARDARDESGPDRAGQNG